MGYFYVRRRVCLTFALFAVLAEYQPATGQDIARLPSLELPKPGIAKAIPNDVKLPSGILSVEALSAPLIGRAFQGFGAAHSRSPGYYTISE
jgi:hypothetical protein